MRSAARTALAGLALLLAGTVALAQDAVLTITDGTDTVELSRDDLLQMEQEVIETSSKWLEGVNKFSGPTMSDVLEKAGFSGETVNAEALDKYSLDVPRENLTGDGAILAVNLNDAPLPEDQAPFWIVFPYDQKPETNNEDHQSWSVYKLAKLTVK